VSSFLTAHQRGSLPLDPNGGLPFPDCPMTLPKSWVSARGTCEWSRGTDEEGHLSGEDEFVALKESPRGVDEDRVGDAVNQVDDALFHLLRRLGAVNRLLEHDAERLHHHHHHTDTLINSRQQSSRVFDSLLCVHTEQ